MTLGEVQQMKKIEQMQERDFKKLSGASGNSSWLDNMVIVILIIIVAYLIGKDALPRMIK